MEELVKRLRAAAIMSDALSVFLPHSEGSAVAKLYNEAADAIEKLTADLERSKEWEGFWEEQAEEVKGKLQQYALAVANKPRWIPVRERLPKNLASVIVHRKDGGIFIWEYFDTSPTDECWIDDSMNVYSFYDVTHWMPLPQPPKEE